MINEQVLFFGLPINFSEEAILYQPTLKEMLEKNVSFEQLLEPFITLDRGHFSHEKDDSDLREFDMFFIQIAMGYTDFYAKSPDVDLISWLKSDSSNGLVVKRLINTLEFLFKTTDIQLQLSSSIIDDFNKNYITINKSYKIDRDTYSLLKQIVCEIFDTEIKITPKKEMSAEESELERRFAEAKAKFEAEHRKSKAKNKDNISLFTLVNYIIHHKISQYDYNSIQSLTIYQIKNTFKYYQSQEVYDVDLSYRSSGNFKIEGKSSHWFFDK